MKPSFKPKDTELELADSPIVCFPLIMYLLKSRASPEKDRMLMYRLVSDSLQQTCDMST
jgi:hypothetical protein